MLNKTLFFGCKELESMLIVVTKAVGLEQQYAVAQHCKLIVELLKVLKKDLEHQFNVDSLAAIA